MIKKGNDFKNDGLILGGVPLNCILWWNKGNMGGGSVMPYGYLECNGQVISDVESPLNGQTVPDLNTSGGKKFIRGSTAAGAVAGSDTACHQHAVNLSAGNVNVATATTGNNFVLTATASGAGVTSGSGVSGFTSVATIPVCIEMVPIIRVK